MIPVRRVRFPSTSATSVPTAARATFAVMTKNRALLIVVLLVLLAVLARKVRDV